MTALSPSERWAHFRFASAALLAAPPQPGEIKTAIEALAEKTCHHAISGEGRTVDQILEYFDHFRFGVGEAALRSWR